MMDHYRRSHNFLRGIITSVLFLTVLLLSNRSFAQADIVGRYWQCCGNFAVEDQYFYSSNAFSLTSRSANVTYWQSGNIHGGRNEDGQIYKVMWGTYPDMSEYNFNGGSTFIGKNTYTNVYMGGLTPGTFYYVRGFMYVEKVNISGGGDDHGVRILSGNLATFRTYDEVSSITLLSANPNNYGAMDYRVNFYGPVDNLTASNFSLLQSGNLGATISNVSRYSTTQYTVTVSVNPLSQGSVALRMENSNGASNRVNNLPYNSGYYTVDRIPPVKLTFAGITDDTGIAGDGITTDNTPRIDGNAAEAGTTIRVYRGGTLVNSFVPSSNGSWTYQLPTTADGTYTYTAQATDAVGNVSPISDPLVITIDRSAPATPPVVTSITDDTGFSNTDRLTNDRTLTLTGTAEAKGTVTVTRNGDNTYYGTAQVNTSGNWQYTTPALADGYYRFNTTVTDEAGNTSAVSTSTDMTVDATAPVLNVVSIQSNNANTRLAKVGNVITLNFRPSETLQTPVVSIATHPVTPSYNSGSSTWTATYTMTAADTEGTVPFSINFTDIAGNTASTSATTDATQVRFDRTIPVLSPVVIYSDNGVDIHAADNGDEITVNFTSSEALLTVPVLQVNGENVTLTQTGNVYTGKWFVRASYNTQGAIPFRITGITDLAGNNAPQVSAPTDAAEVIFDNAPPVLTTIHIQSDNENTSYARTGDVITLTFTANEYIKKPSVNILGRTIAAANVNSTDNINWTVTYQTVANDVQGQVNFTISNLQDRLSNISPTAGSASTDGSKVTFDITNPNVYNVAIASNNPLDQAKTRVGDVITLKFSGTEAIQKPAVKISGHDLPAADITSSNGIDWEAVYTMAQGDPEGTVTFLISGVKDLTSNAATSTYSSTNNASSVLFDKTLPLITAYQISTSNTNPERAKVGDKISLTYTTSETVASVVTIAGHTITASSAGNNWSAEYVLTDTDTEGLVPYVISITDLANNNTTANNTSTIEFDRTTPEVNTIVLTTSNTRPELAIPGDLITLTFETDEATIIPVVTIAGHSVIPVSTADKVWKATYTMAVGDTEGAIPYSVTATDLAGNITPVANPSTVIFKTAPRFDWTVIPVKTYGNDPFTTTAVPSHTESPVVYSSSNPAVASIDANTGLISIHKTGVTEITASQAESAHYLAHDQKQVVTVNPAVLVAKIQPAEKVYLQPNPVFTATYSGFVLGEQEAVIDTKGVVTTVANVDNNTGAGNYALKFATAPADDNYTFVLDQSAMLAVKKAAATITFNALPGKTYGDAGFAPGATANHTESTVVYTSNNPAVATIVNGSIHITGAGEAIITASLAESANYNAASSVQQSVVVGKAALTITAENKSKVYGEANPAFTFTYSGFKYSDTQASLAQLPSATTNAVVNSPVGSYAITPLNDAASGNYTFTYVPASLQITKKDLNVRADNKSRRYGENNPVLTVSYSGFISGETAAQLSVQPLASTAATTTTPTGSYDINVGGAVSGNYNFIYTKGSLSIGRTDASINFAALPANKKYGDADFGAVASGIHTESPLTYSSSNQAVASIDADGTIHIKGAGTTNITVSQAASGNYAAVSVNQELNIAKAPLTLTADDQSKKFGEENPELTVSHAGFVNNEDFANLLSLPVAATSATTSSPVGQYEITLSGATSNNYDITMVSGTLKVLRNTATISFSALPAKTYGDAGFNAGVLSNHTESPINYSSSDPAVATIDANGNILITGAGTTTITTLQAASTNYEAATEVNQVLTVHKAQLRIVSVNDYKRYKEANPTLQVQYIGWVNGEDQTVLTRQPDITTTAGLESEIGNYPVTASGVSAANYDITYIPGVLIVNPTNSFIGFDRLATKTYGDADFSAAATSVHNESPLTYVSSDENVATVASDGTIHIHAAGHTIITVSQAAGHNYIRAEDMSQALTVVKAKPVINVSEVNEKTFGDADFSVAAQSINTEAPVDYNSSLTGVATVSNLGSVTITGAGVTTITLTQPATANFEEATPVTWNLRVKKKAAEITFAEIPAKTYSDPDFAAAATSNHSEAPIVYGSSNSIVAGINGGMVVVKGAGAAVITARQAETANYLAASVARSLTVNKALPVINFADLPVKTRGDADWALTAQSPSNETPLLFRSENSEVVTVEGSIAHIVSSGKANITAYQVETANYLAASTTKLLTVLPKTPENPFVVNPATPEQLADSTATGQPGKPDTIAINLKNSTIKGTGEPGSTVVIYVDGVQVGTTIIDDLGNWSYTLGDTIREGEHEVTVKIINKEGSESEISSPVVIVVDLTPPVPAAQVTEGAGTNKSDDVSADNGGTITANTPTPVITGKAEPGSIVAIWVEGESAPRDTVQTDANGNWEYTFNPPLSEGSHTVEVIVTDKAGNESGKTPVRIIVDTIVPEATAGANAGGNITNDGSTNNGVAVEYVATPTPTLSGKAEPGTKVEIWIDGALVGQVDVDAQGNWSWPVTTPLTEGAHNVVIIVKDAAGNRSEPIKETLHVDTGRPEVAPAPAINPGDGTVTDGKVTLIYGDTQTIVGTGEPGSTVIIIVDGQKVGEAIVGADGKWEYTFSPILSEGEHGLSIIIKDAAGNESPVSDKLTVVIKPAIISFNLPVKTYLDADFSVGAVTSNTDEVLTYSSSNTGVATVDVNGIIHITGAGKTTITVAQAAGKDYSAVSLSHELVVKKAQQKITAGQLPVMARYGAAQTLQTSASSGLTVELVTKNPLVVQTEGHLVKPQGVGTATIVAQQKGDNNYLPAEDVVIAVSVEDPQGEKVIVHKIVSPNGDGINDMLEIEGLTNFPEHRFTIVNRNGVKVFTTSSYDTGLQNSSVPTANFTGIRFRVDFLPEGTYFYQLEYKDGGAWKQHSGYFVLKF